MLDHLVGGFNPSENYESQLATIIPNLWKNKIHVPNHQSVTLVTIIRFIIHILFTMIMIPSGKLTSLWKITIFYG